MQLIDAPELIAPSNELAVTTGPSYRWTPVRMGAAFATYELTVTALEPGQKNALQAVENNPPLYQVEMTMPQYQHLPSDPLLEAGKKYAWRVRAFDPDGRYTFQNNGKSPAWTFTWQPGIAIKPTLKDKKVEKIKQGIGTKVKEDPHIGVALQAVMKNCTLNGQYYYTFEKADLAPEHKFGKIAAAMLPNVEVTRMPMRHVSLRLVRKYITVPFIKYGDAQIDDVTTGKHYNTLPKTVATTHTDGQGNFHFDFIGGDSTVVAQGHKFHTGGNTEFQDNVTGTLYRYYTVEVVDPRYCTSNSQIAVEPGETKDIFLTSLVRTYNLDVKVLDARFNTPLGYLCNVYVARPMKIMIPITAPVDEGELGPEAEASGSGQMKVAVSTGAPVNRYEHPDLGYVIGIGNTKSTADSGHVLFKRLVRNTEGSDGYYISARTPLYLPGHENLNDLYYYNADKANWISKPSKYFDDYAGDGSDASKLKAAVKVHIQNGNVAQSDSDLGLGDDGMTFDPGYDYSAEVVYNTDYTIPTFSTVVKIEPRKPRFFGRVKMWESDSDLVNIQVKLLQNSNDGSAPKELKCTYSNIRGEYELADVEPTGGSETYKLQYWGYGYETQFVEPVTVQWGYQTKRGTISMVPRKQVGRRVVDEWAKPLSGVRASLGKGPEVITASDGKVWTRAVPGYQRFLFEKKPDYAVLDSNAYVISEDKDISYDDPKKWVVLPKAHRRVHIQVAGGGKWIQGAEVTLLDKVGAPSGSKPLGVGAEQKLQQSGQTQQLQQSQQTQQQQQQPLQQQQQQLTQQGQQLLQQTQLLPELDYWTRRTNVEGIVTFVYDSPEDFASFSIRVPNSIWVPKTFKIVGIEEDLHWYRIIVELEAGGIVAGSVYAGAEHRRVVGDDSLKQARTQGQQGGKHLQTQEAMVPELQNLGALTAQQMAVHLQTLFKEKIRPPNPPVANAHVWVDGHDEISTYTDQNGDFVLMGVPPGARIIKAAREATRADSIFIGEKHTVTVVAKKTSHIDFYLRPYLGMDLTKIYGFPIELDALTELPGGSVRVSGGFIDVPSNSIFRLKNDTGRIEFANIVLSPAKGVESPAPPVSPSGSVPLLPASIQTVAYGKYIVDLAGTPGIAVGPDGSDLSRGRITGNAELSFGSFNLNSNELELADSAGSDIPLFLGYAADQQNAPPEMKIAPIVSQGGALDTRGAPLRLARLDGSDARARLFDYEASFANATSWLESDGMHLHTTLHVTVQSCGASMGSSCDVALFVGDQKVGQSGLQPLDPSHVPAQDIRLQKWILHAQSFAFAGDYLTFDGVLKTPLLANLNTEETKLNIPFTKLELRPDKLAGGHFTFSELDLLGIAKMKFTKPFTFAVDAQSWFITSKEPYVTGDLGNGTHLEGMTADTKILLDNFYLRSDGMKDITPAQNAFVSWDVATFQPASFMFDYIDGPFISMQGSLKLINVPDLAPQFTNFVYIAGGKFTMQPVMMNSPFNAGGVQISIAHGVLGPDGFIAEGDWGAAHNRVILEGSFSLNMWFRHRKVGPNSFSTIAEIINPNHDPPQNQALFHNTDGTDVWSVYGRTQLEADMSWSTNLVGWYRTQELAGKDSMRYVVVGTGGHGTVSAGTGTLKMKGTSGGLSMLQNGNVEQFPKGPSEPPPEEESDGPFSNFEIRMDFEMLAIIASVDINAEISGGVTFTGNITTVLAFGPKKFWSFFAAGKGEVANPPCNGSAVFLAGANYEVIPEQLQIIIDYSISKRDLPPEFKTITGFFTQVAVTLPIPGTPNFDIDLGFAGLRIECSMGGEARVGLNFQNGTTFFLGLYFTAKVQVDAFIEINAFVLGFKASAQLLVQVGIGGWFTYNSDAGASFDFMGFIIGKLTFGGCLIVMGEEAGCGEFTLFEVGGEVKGRVGNGEYLEITPTFSFLGL